MALKSKLYAAKLVSITFCRRAKSGCFFLCVRGGHHMSQFSSRWVAAMSSITIAIFKKLVKTPLVAKNIAETLLWVHVTRGMRGRHIHLEMTEVEEIYLASVSPNLTWHHQKSLPDSVPSICFTFFTTLFLRGIFILDVTEYQHLLHGNWNFVEMPWLQPCLYWIAASRLSQYPQKTITSVTSVLTRMWTKCKVNDAALESPMTEP